MSKVLAAKLSEMDRCSRRSTFSDGSWRLPGRYFDSNAAPFRRRSRRARARVRARSAQRVLRQRPENLVEEIGAHVWISGHVHDASRAVIGETLVSGISGLLEREVGEPAVSTGTDD